MKKVVVISVGGSIIVPDEVDYNFLERFKVTIKKLSRKYKIVVCAGGGHTARDYIGSLRRLGVPSLKQSYIGIAATRINALLLAFAIVDCNQRLPESLNEVKSLLGKHDIVVCGGLRPGRTSDGTTAEIAEYLEAKTMINMTNVSGLYTKDPTKYDDAKFIPRISHADFAKRMARIKEKPGQHFVLDSVAARIARRRKMEVVILEGVKNLDSYLSGKKFKGTVIR